MAIMSATGNDLIDSLIVAASVVIALGGAIAILRKPVVFVLATLREFKQFLSDWSGEPARPGVPERPGVLARISQVEATQQELASAVSGIRAQFENNGGQSLRDRVDRIEEYVNPERENPPT